MDFDVLLSSAETQRLAHCRCSLTLAPPPSWETRQYGRAQGAGRKRSGRG